MEPPAPAIPATPREVPDRLSSLARSFPLRQTAVDLGGQLDQRLRDLQRIGCTSFEPAQRLGQACQIAGRTRPDLGKRRSWFEASPVSHDRLNQRFARLIVAFNRKGIAIKNPHRAQHLRAKKSNTAVSVSQ